MPRGLRLGLTMLILRPSNALSSVDLPTFGRPTIAAKPQRNAQSSMGGIGPIAHGLRTSLAAFVEGPQWHELCAACSRAAPARPVAVCPQRPRASTEQRTSKADCALPRTCDSTA